MLETLVNFHLQNLQQHDSLMQLTVYIKILISKIEAESSPIKSVRTKL